MIEIISKEASKASNRKVIAVGDVKLSSGSWISLTAPTSQELQSTAESLNLKKGNLEDALDTHESPRLDHDSDHSYLFVRWPQVNKDRSTNTHPLLIVYGAKDIITVSITALDVIDSMLGEDSDFSTASSKETVLRILRNVFNEYEIYIKGQSDSVKRIVNKMRQNKLGSEDFIHFVLVEEQIGNFLSALEPAVPLLRRLSTSKHFILTDNDRDKIEDIVLSVEQSIHICNMNISRIVSVREAYAALSNNSLNRTMKALTAATLIIALPNVMFGMYGMNIDLPIQNSPWAFSAIIGSAGVAILTIVLIAKRNHWF